MLYFEPWDLLSSCTGPTKNESGLKNLRSNFFSRSSQTGPKRGQLFQKFSFLTFSLQWRSNYHIYKICFFKNHRKLLFWQKMHSLSKKTEGPDFFPQISGLWTGLPTYSMPWTALNCQVGIPHVNCTPLHIHSHSRTERTKTDRRQPPGLFKPLWPKQLEFWNLRTIVRIAGSMAH